jgi:putative transposase
MGAAAFEAGTIVRIEGSEHQLVKKNSESSWWIESLKSRTASDLSVADMLSKYANGTLSIVAIDAVGQLRPATIAMTDAELESAKMRRIYVLAVLNLPNSRQPMRRAISETWEKLGRPGKPPSWTTIYRLKKRYLAAGNDIRALLDNHYKKGNRSERYPEGLILIAKEAIATRYLTRERNSIQATLEDAKLRVYRQNKLLPESMAIPAPTRRLIRRLISQIPADEKYAARYGREAARKHFRGVLGQRWTQRPLERAEVDHTALDLFVIDDKTALPLGRPYLTVCLDHYTRCILGIYIGFTPPSFVSVARCLRDCFRPKLRLKHEYPEIEHEWLAFGVMDQLVVDNGNEFQGNSLDQLCGTLGIEIHFSPRATPWFKGSIESFFRTFNHGFASRIPGKTFSNIAERGDYDPSKDACISLSRLNMLARKWISDIYHQEIHRTLQLTPAAMWKQSVKLEDIRLPDETMPLDAVLGSVALRKVTHKGVEFMGLLYNSPELVDLRRRDGDGFDVELRVDEMNIGKVFVFWPGNRDPLPVPALQSRYADGLSLYAHKKCREVARQASGESYDEIGLLEAKHSIQKMIEEDFMLNRRRTRKRIARFIEGAGRQNLTYATAPAHSEEQGSTELPAAREPLSDPAGATRVINPAEELGQQVPTADDLPDFEIYIKGDQAC